MAHFRVSDPSIDPFKTKEEKEVEEEGGEKEVMEKGGEEEEKEVGEEGGEKEVMEKGGEEEEKEVGEEGKEEEEKEVGEEGEEEEKEYLNHKHGLKKGVAKVVPRTSGCLEFYPSSMTPVFIFTFCLLAVSLAAPNDPYALNPTCGQTGRSCIQTEGKCQNGGCVCWNPWGYTWGIGDFRCYKQNQRGCEIKNDPKLTTFDRETESFPFPCRYLASHVRPQLKDRHGNVIGYCEAKVYGMNAKINGKMVVMGFDVALRLVYTQSNNIVQSSFRHYGIASNNVNNVQSYGKNGAFLPFVPDGSENIEYRDSPNGVRVDTDWDRRDNRLSYLVTGCGIKVTFVPYDKGLHLAQKQVPGLAISVDKTYQPQWLSGDKAMCLVPKSDGGQNIRDIKEENLNRERSLLLRAFKNQPEQNLPFSTNGATNVECTTVGTILNSCPPARQRQAIRNCDWILKEPHFMKCYDNTRGSPNLLRLFRSCVTAWCRNRPCTETITAIRNSGCGAINNVPHLPGFMAGNFCPQEEPG
ncbi:hypothetical protein RRG08_056548 [Elysia crispata]|uniref:Uncharacterized protein n=1 Tax=Elysia crispata TaxID=231223 RepID=A0AAE0YFC3_9GAST|nr:hypothetical protein RRG08_056548 [Elysia crispata]